MEKQCLNRIADGNPYSLLPGEAPNPLYHQYIISYRIKEARKLLAKDISVSETALQTGFSDVKTFSRSFKKNTGAPPSVYRESENYEP